MLITSLAHHFYVEVLIQGVFGVQSSQTIDFSTFLYSDNSETM